MRILNVGISDETPKKEMAASRLVTKLTSEIEGYIDAHISPEQAGRSFARELSDGMMDAGVPADVVEEFFAGLQGR